MLFRTQPQRPPQNQVPVWWTPQALATLQFQQAQQQANEANQARYNQSFNELQNLRSQDMQDLQGQGQSAMADIRDAYRGNQSAVAANLAARGLSNSTLQSTLAQGANRQYVRQMMALKENLARQRIGVRQADTSRLVSLIGSKVDRGPNAALLSQLMQGMGAGGMGAPGMPGGPPVYQSPVPAYQNWLQRWSQDAMGAMGMNPQFAMAQAAGFAPPQGFWNPNLAMQQDWVNGGGGFGA